MKKIFFLLSVFMALSLSDARAVVYNYHKLSAEEKERSHPKKARYALSEWGHRHLERIVPARDRHCTLAHAERRVNELFTIVAENEDNDNPVLEWNQDFVDAFIILTVRLGLVDIAQTELYRRMTCCRSSGNAVDYLDYRFTAAAIRDIDLPEDEEQAVEIYKVAIFPADRYAAGDKYKQSMFFKYEQSRYPEHVSESFRQRLRKHEGCSLVAYEDGGTAKRPRYSIGYGHNGARRGQRITMAEAQRLLDKDINAHEMYVKAALERINDGSKVSQALFDALVDLSYNSGPISFQPNEKNGSTNKFWATMKRGKFDNAAQIGRLMKVYRNYHVCYRGKPHKGLKSRRAYHAERVENSVKSSYAKL